MVIRRILKAILLTVGGILLMLVIVVAGYTLRADLRAHSVTEEELAALRPAGGFMVHADDTEMFVQRVGSVTAPAVVFVSGTGGWSGIWKDFMARVAAEGYQAIALDVPPFGYSSAPSSGRYDKASQARRILGALDSLRVQSAVIVAHSIGSGAVVEAALSHPERVSRMILVNPALGLDAPREAESGSFLLELIRSRWFSEPLCAAVGTNPWFTPYMVKSFVAEKDKVTPAWIELYQKPLEVPGAYRNVAGWLPVLFEGRGALPSDDPEAYRTLQVPTTLIWGKDDTITPLAQGERLHSLLPRSRLVLLPGGHVPMVEEPQLFIAALVDSLAAAD